MSRKIRSTTQTTGDTRASGRHYRLARSAFTLIELIVVVAILAIMVAILIPAVGKAKQRSKTELCAENMRKMGQLISIYVSQNNGRLPGSAHSPQGQAAGSSGTSVSWYDFLNIEILDQRQFDNLQYNPNNSGDQYGVSAGHSVAPSSRTLSCPNFQPIPYTLPYAYNLDASGGPVTSNGGTYVYNTPSDPYRAGPYGLAVNPATMSVTGATAAVDGSNSIYDNYNYGAIMSRFNPNQFVIIEFDYDNSTTSWSSSDYYAADYPFVFGADNAQQPYSGTDGLTFRHPYANPKSNVRSTSKANFLCFDNHIELLGPSDDVCNPKHYGIP